MSHSSRLRFWSRMAWMLGLGQIEWRADEDGGWFCTAQRVGVPCIARGRTGADSLKELVLFARRIR